MKTTLVLLSNFNPYCLMLLTMYNEEITPHGIRPTVWSCSSNFYSLFYQSHVTVCATSSIQHTHGKGVKSIHGTDKLGCCWLVCISVVGNDMVVGQVFVGKDGDFTTTGCRHGGCEGHQVVDCKETDLQCHTSVYSSQIVEPNKLPQKCQVFFRYVKLLTRKCQVNYENYM